MKAVFNKKKSSLYLFLLYAFFINVTLLQQIHSQVLGVRRAEEMLLTFESLTNVTRLEARIRSFYNSHNLSLPQTGKMEEYNASAILAAIGLSSNFCEAMIERDMTLDPADSWAHRNTDLKKDILLWDVLDIENLISEYAEVFWGKDVDEEELKMLVSLFETYRLGSPNATKMTTLVGVCAFMLSTPYVLVK